MRVYGSTSSPEFTATSLAGRSSFVAIADYVYTCIVLRENIVTLDTLSSSLLVDSCRPLKRFCHCDALSLQDIYTTPYRVTFKAALFLDDDQCGFG